MKETTTEPQEIFPDCSEYMEGLSLRMSERAEVLQHIPFTDTSGLMEKTEAPGVLRQPRNKQRDVNSRALIEVMREFAGCISNEYLQSAITRRVFALDDAIASMKTDYRADEAPAKALIATAKYYADLLPAVIPPRSDAPEERARIIEALEKNASAIEQQLPAYLEQIFDDTAKGRKWREAAQQLVDALRDAKPYLPVWAADVRVKINAAPFVKAARNRDANLTEQTRLIAEDARKVAAVLK